MDYQEIGVYLVLILAIFYLIRKNIAKGKNNKNDNKGCNSGSGGCGCS